MPQRPVLYYITDRSAFPGDERARRQRLLDKIAEAAIHGIDYIQLREKDLSTRDLESLAREAIQIIRKQEQVTDHRQLTTVLLVNSRTDVALAAAAAGVHLPANDLSPGEVISAWSGASAPSARSGQPLAREPSPRIPLIGVSCHSIEEVTQAATNSATFAVFGPVFQKKDTPSANPPGLGGLRQACQAKIPVLALGGITMENAKSCMEAGAAGIAAIRLFQENDISAIVRELGGNS